MSIRIEDLSGQPLIAVIDQLCMSASPRWKDFRGEIEIFPKQLICYHSPDYVSRGIWDISAELSAENLQKESDATAFAAALRPVFEALLDGRLSLSGYELPVTPDAKQFQISSFMMREPWKLTLVDGLVLWAMGDDGNSTCRFRVNELMAASTNDQTIKDFKSSAELEPKVKKKSGRKPEYDWDGAETSLLLYFENEGAPGSEPGAKAHAEKHVADWFAQRLGGKHPTESLIREHVDKVILRFERVRVEGR